MKTLDLSKLPATTPWGLSDEGTEFAPGIVFYSTPRHGGFHLSAERIAEMPEKLRNIKPFAGPGWYEEDCDWAIVCAAFPWLFDTEQQGFAWSEIKRRYGWIPSDFF